MLSRPVLTSALGAVMLAPLVWAGAGSAALRVEARHDSAVVTFRTEHPAQLQVEYGQPGRLGLYAAAETVERREHRAALHGLDPERPYAVRVRMPGGAVELARFQTEPRPRGQRHSSAQGRRILLDGEPFLPIMSWAQCPETMAGGRALGIDVFVGPPCAAASTQLDAASAVGALAAVPFDGELRDHPALFGYHHEDEPDAAGTMPPAVTSHGAAMAAADPAHVRILTVSRHFYTPPFAPFPWLAEDVLSHYQRYASAADLSGFVLYPRWILCDASLLALVADMQQRYTENVAPGRPTFQWIEAAARNNPACTGERAGPVTADEVAAESWMSIVHGATAIGYFTITYATPDSPPQPLDVSPQVAEMLGETNAELKVLGPAILSERVALSVAALEGRLDASARSRNGAVYVFAVNPGAAPARARIVLPSAANRPARDWRTGTGFRFDGDGGIELGLPALGSAVLVLPPAGLGRER